MKWGGAILAGFLSLIGCSPKDPLNAADAPLTEGEIKAMKEDRGPGWAYQVTFGNDGKVLEEGWHYSSPPVQFKSEGLSHLPDYIDKLLVSKNWFSSVDAFTLDDSRCVSVWKIEGKIELQGSFNKEDAAEEKLARKICEQSGYATQEDYLLDDSSRMISWTLPHDRNKIFGIMRRFALEVHKIPEDAGLKLKFEEHEDERDNFKDQDGITLRTLATARRVIDSPPDH